MLLYEQKIESKAGKHSFQVSLALYPVLSHCLLSSLTAPQANNIINMQFWEVLQGPREHTTKEIP